MSEIINLDEAVELFKEEWKWADDNGFEGLRVRHALRAVLFEYGIPYDGEF